MRCYRNDEVNKQSNRNVGDCGGVVIVIFLHQHFAPEKNIRDNQLPSSQPANLD